MLPFLLIGFIVAFLFLSNQKDLYMIHNNSDLFYDIYNTINKIIKEKLTLPFTDSKLFWYLFSIEQKSSFITLSALLFIMISYHHFLNALRALHHDLWKKYGYLLLLIEFCMCQDFLRLFVMFSTECFISITVTSIFDIIVTPKITD